MLDLILSYQPLKQQYPYYQLQEFAKAYDQIKDAESILGDAFIVNEQLKLGNLRENSELHLNYFINEKIEEIIQRNQKVQNQLTDVDFDENLKYLFPVTLRQNGALDIENSQIAKDLDVLSIFSENFPLVFSIIDYEVQKEKIINDIDAQLLDDFDFQMMDTSEENHYKSVLLKLSYLFYQYYPIQSEDIKNKFFQIVQENLKDANLKSKVASLLQELSFDTPLALIAIRLGFKDWEIKEINNLSIMGLSEDQDKLLNGYEFHNQQWDYNGMKNRIKSDAIQLFQQILENDLSSESFLLDLKYHQGLDLSNPQWGMIQSTESFNNVIKLYYFLSKSIPELLPSKLQLMSSLSLVGFSRIPYFQDNFNNQALLETDETQSHLQSTLFQMLPGSGVTTSLQVVALLLSLHGFQVTLVVRGDPNASRQAIEDIINELECPIEIKNLDQVLEESQVYIDNKVRNNRVLIVEQFDQVVDIAENITEKYEIIKDADLDNILNLMWEAKDVPFKQEYFSKQIQLLKVKYKDTLNQKQELLEKAISEILFDMRTCEVVDAPSSNSYKEYFVKLKQKPEKQQVIKNFEIKLKIKEIKNFEFLTSHFNCILGTYSTHMTFESQIMIQSLLKIKHIINLYQDFHLGQNQEEKFINFHEDPSDFGTQLKKIIKMSDAAVLIVDNKEDLNEINDFKNHMKYLKNSESVIVKQSTILVVKVDQIDSILTLIKNKNLKFLLKTGSNIAIIRTCFFNEPYYQPSFLHHRIDQVFKDFNLSKYLLLKQDDIKESLQDKDLTMKVVQKNKIINTFDRILPSWTEDWMNICKINFVIDNPTKEQMQTHIIPSLQQVISNQGRSFIKVTISYITESHSKLIQTGWESDFKSLQAAINQLNLQSEINALSNSQNEMIEHYKNILYHVKHNLDCSSLILSDTQIVLICQNSRTYFDHHELSQKLVDDKYKVSVIIQEQKPFKFEESSLVEMSVYEEIKNQDQTGIDSNLVEKIAKSINFKVNSAVTPGGDKESAAFSRVPQPFIQQNQIEQAPIYEDFPLEEEDDFMAMVARSSIGSFQKPQQKVQLMDFQPPKEMIKPSYQIQRNNSQQIEEEKKPIMMMSSFERERKIKEVKSKIDIIIENTSRLSNDIYYFKNVKILFEKLLEILQFGIDQINIYDIEYAILTNIPQGKQILETIGFKEDPFNFQNLILISQNQDKQLKDGAVKEICEALRQVEIQFDPR